MGRGGPGGPNGPGGKAAYDAAAAAAAAEAVRQYQQYQAMMSYMQVRRDLAVPSGTASYWVLPALPAGWRGQSHPLPACLTFCH